MAQTTPLKDAIKQWEEKKGAKAAESEEVKLYGILPPIMKMDNSLSTLKKCRHLSLSSHSIEKISNLSGLDSLEILSLGRNQIKKLEGLDNVADTLRELWISYNQIDKLNGIEKLKNLQVLYMSNNLVAKWPEFERLRECPQLGDLVFVGNPLVEGTNDDHEWRCMAAGRLHSLKKLDGEVVLDEDREEGMRMM